MLFPLPSRLHRLAILVLRLVVTLRAVTSRTTSYLRIHWIGTLMLALGVASSSVLVIFWSFWMREIPLGLAALSQLILDFARRHPHVSRILHISLEAVPDVAFVLLALAGLSYLMPELMQKFEKNRALRLSAFVLFLVFGVAAVVLNAVNREGEDNQRQIDRNKMDGLSGQVQDTLHFLVQSKGQPNELERRRHIIDTLRSEYILAHPEASAAMIAGTIDPPLDWMNKRLQQLGEQWKYVQPAAVSSEPTIQRSYLVFDDVPMSSGGEIEGKPLVVGQVLQFNIHFKQQGPNPVELVSESRWLYVEADYESSTQKALIDDFEERLAKEERRQPSIGSSTVMPGDQRFFTAFGRNEDGSPITISPMHLDDLMTGKEILFVIAQLIYRDAGKEHHLRRCMYLQPPANTPWIWHFCEGFAHSD
jgi:hypothetical protein